MANGPQRAPFRGPMARLATEAVERLATPEVAARLIADALAAASLDDVPEDTGSFGSFASGALHIAVREALGEEAAEAVMQDLEPAFLRPPGIPSSGVRKRGRESLTRPATPDRVVIVASGDRDLVDELVPSFGEDTKVVAAYDMFGLLQSSQRYLSNPVILLLHDEMASLKPSSLATLARVMPRDTTIVQFGGAKVEPDRSQTLPDLTWIRLGDAPAHAVLEAVAGLIPRSKADRGPSRRVILAHGDAALRTEIGARLRAAGHAVTETRTGFEALDRCIDELPEVVVAAADVPAIDGGQLAKLIASRFGNSAPEVVLLGDPKAARSPDVHDVLPPDDLQLLLDWLR